MLRRFFIGCGAIVGLCALAFCSLVAYYIVHPSRETSARTSTPSPVAIPSMDFSLRSNALAFDTSNNHLNDTGNGLEAQGLDDQMFRNVADIPTRITADPGSQSAACAAKVRSYASWIPAGVQVACSATQKTLISDLGNPVPSDAGSHGPSQKDIPGDAAGLTTFNGDDPETYWALRGHPGVNIAMSFYAPDVMSSDQEFRDVFFHELGHVYSQLYTGAASYYEGSFADFRKAVGVPKDTDYRTSAIEQFARGFATCFHGTRTDAQRGNPQDVTPSCATMQAFRQQIKKTDGIDLAKKPLVMSSSLVP